MTNQILVTGGLGFIGASFIRTLVAQGHSVLNVDLDTYAGDPRRLADLDNSALETAKVDIADPEMEDLIIDSRPRCIIHFAAETHVTRSETDMDRFFRTNVEGTRRVLEGAKRAGTSLVLHVSTDEVYGPCPGLPFKESDKAPGEGNATSAYARSKAVADDLAAQYAGEVPVIVARLTNCFGPWQHPEKAIPRWTIRALTGQRIPVWGLGGQVRDWMFVEDAADAMNILIEYGSPGEIYNVAPMGTHISNLAIATQIARIAGRDDQTVYLTAYDRPHHDERYSVDAAKIHALGWRTSELHARIAETVQWYRDHRDWWSPLVVEAEQLYDDEFERS